VTCLALVLSRLFEWVFYHVNSEEILDDAKAVFLRGLHEVLSSDGGKSPHGPILPVSRGTNIILKSV